MIGDRQGQIFTFYSYKGGTGRSMALTNVAWILASQGKRVLVIDWDLEAPGSHRYFRPFLPDKELKSTNGVIDFIIGYADQVLTPAHSPDDVSTDWIVEEADITRYAVSLMWEFTEGGALDLVPAGRQDAGYSRRVNSFDWQNFYERLGGGAFLESARASMRAQFDYTLIDSRTGVSDTAGISTVQLPDKLVVCFTLNNQSIEGAAAVADSVAAQRPDMPILPVPMRVELSEKDKVALRRAHARERLGKFPAQLRGSARDEYWSAVETLYVPFYAYEEILATFADEPAEGHSVLRAAEQLTRYLTDGAVQSAETPSRDLREWVRDQFKQRPIDLEQARKRLENMPIDEALHDGPLPEGSRVLITRSPNFVGRGDVIKRLAEAVQRDRCVGLVGIPGVGKTQIAAEFAYRYGQFFSGGVFWLSFSEPSSVPFEMVACAGPAIAELRPHFRSLVFAEQLRDMVSAFRSDVPRLLIFDSCEDPDLFVRWRPTVGGARVLFTSRRLIWDVGLVPAIVKVGVLPRADSRTLLQSRITSTLIRPEDLNEIAAVLGDLPLALQVASSTLSRLGSGDQVAAFTHTLRQLADASATPTSPDSALDNVQSSITSAFGLSIGRLDPQQPRDRVALDVLGQAANLAPDAPIPQALLRGSVSVETDDAFEDAVKRLGEVGLLEARADGRVSIHRVAAMSVRILLPTTSDVSALDQTLLTLGAQARQHNSPLDIAELMPHLRRSAESADQRNDRLAVPLWNELGSALLNAGNLAGALEVFERALAACERLYPPDDVEQAATLNNLGSTRMALGDYAAARAYLERSLNIYTNRLGPEHPETVGVLANLGSVAQRQGDVEAAFVYLQQVLSIREQSAGDDVLAVASAHNNLGVVLASAGRLADAEMHLRRALALRPSLQPPSPEIASNLNNLGLVLSSEGNLDEARQLFERAVEVSTQALGEDHPDIATARANLASVLAARGDFPHAEELFVRALGIQEKVLGSNHPDVAATLNNLARVQARLGHSDDARANLSRAVAILEQSLGPGNPSTERVRQNLTSLETAAQA